MTQREQFEERAVLNGWVHPLQGLQRTEHGSYLDNYLEERWEAWKEAQHYSTQAVVQEFCKTFKGKPQRLLQFDIADIECAGCAHCKEEREKSFQAANKEKLASSN